MWILIAWSHLLECYVWRSLLGFLFFLVCVLSGFLWLIKFRLKGSISCITGIVPRWKRECNAPLRTNFFLSKWRRDREGIVKGRSSFVIIFRFQRVVDSFSWASRPFFHIARAKESRLFGLPFVYLILFHTTSHWSFWHFCKLVAPLSVVRLHLTEVVTSVSASTQPLCVHCHCG